MVVVVEVVMVASSRCAESESLTEIGKDATSKSGPTKRRERAAERSRERRWMMATGVAIRMLRVAFGEMEPG